jgi:hypothetical protein
MKMPEAVKSDATDRDTLREMCRMRDIPFHHAQKAKSLRALIDDYEARNAPPGDLKDQVEVANPGFASAEPQTPDWDESEDVIGSDVPIARPARPPAPETFTPPQRQIPANVAEALKWLSAYSIGRVNLIAKYIDTLL